MKKLLLTVLTVLLLASPGFALTLPERLVFSVSWSGVKAGTAVQELKAEGDELHIISTTRSVPWLRLFFPVDDRIDSFLPRSGGGKIGVPRLYRERINEGSTHTHKEVAFDTRRLVAHTKDFLGKSQKDDPISSKTYDSLSCFYFVRSIEPLTPGRSLFIDIYDAKHLWNTEVQVLRREEITTPLGTFKTVVIKPLLKSPGIFARTGDIHIWVTDDALRLPVKMTTKVKIGSITATLVGGSYWPEKERE